MVTILRAKPIKVVTVHKDNSETVEMVRPVHKECELMDPRVVDSQFFDSNPADRTWNDSISSSGSSRASSRSFKKYTDSFGKLQIETRVLDKMADNQFAERRRKETIKHLEGILYNDDDKDQAETALWP